MSEIDPEKLEAHVKEARHILYRCDAMELSWKPMLAALTDAAEAHLSTLPRVKEVEVWRVEWAGAGGVPCIDQHTDQSYVEQVADEKRGLGRQCIRVTGPHKQRVPS